MAVPFIKCIPIDSDYKKVLKEECEYDLTESVEAKAQKLIDFGGQFFIKKEIKFDTLIFSTENSDLLCSSLTKVMLSREEETRKNFVVLINECYNSIFKTQT